MFSCLLFTSAFAQDTYNSSGKKGQPIYQQNAQKKGFDPYRLIFGGGMGAGFGNGTLVLGVSPIVGYRITDHFSAGLSLGYQYNWIRHGQYYVDGRSGAIESANINYHIVSPGAWARMLVFENLFLYGQFEYNAFTYNQYQQAANSYGYTKHRNWDKAMSLLPGLGYRQPITNNSSIVIMAGYDVLKNSAFNKRTDAYGNSYSVSPYAPDGFDFHIGLNIGF